MRTWANLPAGLRASSWVSTPSGNGPAHSSGEYRITAPIYLGGLLRTLVHGAPHAEGLQHVHPYGRRPASHKHLRQFSSTATSRIRLEDDEDEDNETSQPKPQRPVRRVVGQQRPAQAKDMRTLILSRKPKSPTSKPAPLLKPSIIPNSPPIAPPPTPQQLRDERVAIEKTVDSLPNFDLFLNDITNSRYIDVEKYMAQIVLVTQGISSAIAEVLYSHTQQLSKLLDESRKHCQQFEVKYCNVVYHRTYGWRGTVSKSQMEISRMKSEFSAVLLHALEENVERSGDNINKMRKSIGSEYLVPRQSARANIDKLLTESEQVQTQYAELQSKGREAMLLLDDIIQLTISLKSVDLLMSKRNGRGFEDFRLLLAEDKKQFGWAAHAYRSAWALRKQTESSFKDAHFWSAKDFTEVLRSRQIQEETSIEVARCRMFADILRRPRELALFRRETVITNYLRRLYMSKWTPKSRRTGDSLMHIAWRQLDVMAPFEIKVVQDWWLQEEVYVLMKSLERQNGPYGPMWTNIDTATLEKTRESLKNFLFGYIETRKAFIKEMRAYKNVNWHRLKIEEKLHKLGVPNYIQEQGLFVPAERLSESVSLFNNWVRLYSAIGFRAWVMRKLNILPIEYTTDELGHKVTKYARLSQIFLKTVQAPFVPEGGTVASARSSPSLARQRRSTGLRVRPVLPVFTRKFGDSGSAPGKADSSPASDDIKQGLSKPAPTESSSTESPSSRTAYHDQDKAHIERAILNKSTSSDISSRYLRRPKPKSKNGHIHSTYSVVPPTPKARQSVAEQQPNPQSKPTLKPIPSQAVPSEAFDKSRTTNFRKGKFGPFPKFEGKQDPSSGSVRSQTTRYPKPAAKVKSDQKKTPSPSTPGVVKTKHHGTPWTGNFFTSAPHNGRRLYSSNTRPNIVRSNVADGDDKSKTATKHLLPPGVLPMAETIDDSNPIESKANCAAAAASAPLFWSHSSHRGPSGQKLIVHYCRNLQSTEDVAQLFLNSKVIGFDMEWKAQAFSWDSIQNNISLIQIANEERIALFHLALFKPGKSKKDFIAPSLRKIVESPDITKVGVAIKGDTTRLRKFLGIQARSIFELSHLFRLVKFSQTTPKLVNKRGVSLSDQVQEHFGLPLEKSDDVRCGDWTVPLSYRQVQYAATDPYACICLFNAMDQKRQAMHPMPPLPAHAELNMPIVFPPGEAVNNDQAATAAMDDAAKIDGL